MQLEQLELPGGGLLTVYLRDCVETMPQAMERPLVLVVPGGGYSHLSAREGDPVALQFAAAGYHAAVLRYAVGDDAAHGLPLRQLAAAIGLVRQHAAAWHVQPDKIAVCGFSAGGHLALSGAVLAVPGLPDPPRPNAVILGYPVITAGEYAHRGSFVQLAGADPAAQQAFSLEDKITPRTPPVFVWHTMEDETVPVENTLLLVSALHRAGVPCEAHLFEKGCHGTSLSTAEVNHPSAHRSGWMTPLISIWARGRRAVKRRRFFACLQKIHKYSVDLHGPKPYTGQRKQTGRRNDQWLWMIPLCRASRCATF